jgi:hypothetical protein
MSGTKTFFQKFNLLYKGNLLGKTLWCSWNTVQCELVLLLMVTSSTLLEAEMFSSCLQHFFLPAAPSSPQKCGSISLPLCCQGQQYLSISLKYMSLKVHHFSTIFSSLWHHLKLTGIALHKSPFLTQVILIFSGLQHAPACLIELFKNVIEEKCNE